MKEKILLLAPENYDEKLAFAMSETRFFLEQTGVECEIVNRTETGSCFISFGNTYKANELGLTKQCDGMKDDGFIIKSMNRGYFILSPTSLGVAFGVYTLLKELCRLEVFAVDEYYISDSVNFKNIDIIEQPDFDFRDRSWLAWNKYDTKLLRRFRLHTAPLITPYHSFFAVLPKEKYLKEHPDWYGEATLQLCITNKEMIAEYTRNCIKLIEKQDFSDKNMVILMIGHEDNYSFCACEKCLESDRKNGGHGGTMILFVNAVAKAVNEHMEKNHPGKTVKTVTFAYGPTVKAPVDEALRPVNNDVLAEKNVGIMFAPLTADYSKSLTDEKYNADICKMFNGYTAIGAEPYIWTYDSIFDDELIYFGEWHNLRKDFDYFKAINAKLVIDMGHYLPNISFDALSNYVRTKLLWNCKLDENRLIEDFFKAFYKECAEGVRQYFDEINENQLLCDKKILLYSERTPVLRSEVFWKKSKLLRWIKILLDSEKLAVSKKIALRVAAERLTPLYLLLEIYADGLTQDELRFYADLFEKDATENGVMFTSEVGPVYMQDINSKLVKWRSLLLK